MGARMRAVQVTRMLQNLAKAGAAPGSHLLGPHRVVPVWCQQTSLGRCRRSSSTESFAWSVGSEPGSSTGAPAGSGARDDGATAGARPNVLSRVMDFLMSPGGRIASVFGSTLSEPGDCGPVALAITMV